MIVLGLVINVHRTAVLDPHYCPGGTTTGSRPIDLQMRLNILKAAQARTLVILAPKMYRVFGNLPLEFLTNQLRSS